MVARRRSPIMSGALVSKIKAVQVEVVRERRPLACNVQYAGAEESKCTKTARKPLEKVALPTGQRWC